MTVNIEEFLKNTEIDFELGLFKEYLEYMEQKLESDYFGARQKYELEEKKISKQTKIIRREKPSYIPERPDSDDLISLQNFGSIMRQSFFVGLMGWLESTLVQECYFQQKTVKCKEFAPGNDVLESVKKYLVDQVGWNFEERFHHWNKIQDYKKLRNCFAHSSGMIQECKYQEHLNQLIQKNDALSLSQSSLYYKSDYIRISQGFCEQVIEVIESFLNTLLYSQ